jgi:F0F1-type ATP synthase membrane subunit c/vacuolar-type H+-ATPase subunit K
MIFISTIFYYIGIIISTAAITWAISYSRAIVNDSMQNGMLFQGYAFNVLKRNYLIIFAIFETPIILVAVMIIYLYNFFSSSYIYLSIFLLASIISIALVSFFTALFYHKPSERFLSSIAAHPNLGGLTSGQLILCLSLIQTPLLITLISIIINCIFLNDVLIKDIFIPINKILILSSNVLLVAIASSGSVIGMQEIIQKYANINIFYPSVSEKNFLNLIISLGLIEAPFIFSFIINLLIVGLIDLPNNNILWIFVFVPLIFGIVAGYAAYQSGVVAARGFSFISENEEKNKKIRTIALFSQIILDSRVLYMFVIIILCMTTLKLI